MGDRDGTDDADVVALLREHWREARPHLTDSDVRLLATSAERIEAAGRDPGSATDALLDVEMMIITRLPPSHPARQALAGRRRLNTGAALDWQRIAHALRALPGIAPEDGPQDDGPDEDDAWLLDGPVLTEQEVRARGCDPARSDLIRLVDAARQVVLPSFQFGPDGQPVAVVAAINRLLEAGEDPWGVADWWLGQNAWLRGIPADLVGEVDDSLLMAAAAADLGEE